MAQTLQEVVDSLTDYYLDLLRRIPDNSLKLFDTMLRQGEPCSQSSIAIRVGAKQNEISRAFDWLHTFGYIKQEPRIKGEKQLLYRATDRIMVQFYRMRYFNQDDSSAIACMADFIKDYYSLDEFYTNAKNLQNKGFESEAKSLLRISYKRLGFDIKSLEEQSTKYLLESLEQLSSLENSSITSISSMNDKEKNTKLKACLKAVELSKSSGDSKSLARHLYSTGVLYYSLNQL